MTIETMRRSGRRLVHKGHYILTFLGLVMLCRCCSGFEVPTTDLRQQHTDAPEVGIMWAYSSDLHINRSLNSMVEFYCGIIAAPTNYQHYRHNKSIAWLKDGVNLDDKLPNSRITKHGWSLRVIHLKSTDSGNYTCIVKSGVDQLQRTFFLKVLYAPENIPILEKKPSNQTVTAGSKVMFECTCLRREPVEMIWARLHLINGTYGSGPLVNDDPHVTILMNWSLIQSPLVLENAQRADEGWYVCGFKNSIGKRYEGAFLTVLEVNTFREDKQSAVDFNYIVITNISLFVFLLISIIIICTVFYYKRKKLRMTQYKLNHKNETPCAEPLVGCVLRDTTTGRQAGPEPQRCSGT